MPACDVLPLLESRVINASCCSFRPPLADVLVLPVPPAAPPLPSVALPPAPPLLSLALLPPATAELPSGMYDDVENSPLWESDDRRESEPPWPAPARSFWGELSSEGL